MENKIIDSPLDFSAHCSDSRVLSLFSDKVGIINAIMERGELRDFGYFLFQSLSTQTKVLFDLDREVSSGGLGIHRESDHAFMASIGEAVERYCMSYCPEKEIIFQRKSVLPKKSVLEDYELYSHEQYSAHPEFINPNGDSELHWTKLTGSLGGELYWPASLVYLPFCKGTVVAETSSTGVAAGNENIDPIQSGLLELIERDALMLNYLHRLHPPEIDLATISGENGCLVQKMQAEYKIKIYKLYTDIRVPVYSGLIWTGEGRDTHYGIGASAALSSEEAIEKVLKECLFTYFYSKNTLHLRVTQPERITKLYEHFLYYQGDLFYQLPFESISIPYQKEAVDWGGLQSEIQERFGEYYYKDLTATDVISSGIRVVKVVVPGLIEMNKSYALRREASSRLFSVPRALGLHVPEVLSVLPHPFP